MAAKKPWIACPKNQRTAIVLSKYDDLSQKEIAEIMITTKELWKPLYKGQRRTFVKNYHHRLKKVKITVGKK